MSKKTYKDFGVAMDELRNDVGVSFDTMSFKIGIAQSYLWGLANRRRASMPKEELINKIADYFHVPPAYFYEHRLRKTLDYINKNRKFLDVIERAMKKYKPSEVSAEEEPEEELVEKRGRI